MVTPKLVCRASLLLFLLSCVTNQVYARGDWYRNLDLEKALSDAKLVMVARVTEVGETKFISGGKGQFSVKQYTFKPVEILKGFYSRDELLLTNNDLRSHYYQNDPLRIGKGEYRLLILGRSDEGYALRHYAPSHRQAIPPLVDERDPLIATAKVLLQISQAQVRSDKVKLAIAGLKANAAHGAIPLFHSLKRRGLIAAQWPASIEAVIPYLSDSSPVVREEAAIMVKELLDADYLNSSSLRKMAVVALVESLSKPYRHIASRAEMLDALGSAGAAVKENDDAPTWLQLGGPSEALAVQSARLRALAKLNASTHREAVLKYYDNLPLDAPKHLQQAAGTVLMRLAGERAYSRIEARIKEKYAAGLGLGTDIELLKKFPMAAAVPLLLEVSKLELDLGGQLAFARVCKQHADPRLVPALAGMLDPQPHELRRAAIDALMEINTKEAALLLKPQLFTEKDLTKKLVLAEFLGHYGYQNGFAFAIEHMSEPRLSQQAVAALIAIRHPRSRRELQRIWETSNDAGWQRPAIEALGGLKASEFTQRFLEIAQNPSDPLAPAAITALGRLRARSALPLIGKGLASGYRDVMVASAGAASSLLSLPAARADRIRDKLASLLADKRNGLAVRMAAFNSLKELGDSRLNSVTANVVDEAGLERTELLRRIEDFLTKHNVRLQLQ